MAQATRSDPDAAAADPLDFASVIADERWQEPADYFRTMPAVLRQTITDVTENDRRLAVDLRARLPALVAEGHLKAWDRGDPAVVAAVRQRRLLTGRVMAVDGTISPIRTQSLVGAQFAIVRVTYQGATGTAVMQLRHSGLGVPINPTADEVVAALDSRGSLRADLPNIYLRAILQFKERQFLLDAGPGIFKLGHGPMFPHEMLSGAGRRHILKPCLELIGRLVDDGAFAMVVSDPGENQNALIHFGAALRPGEFLIADTGDEILHDYLYLAQPDDETGELRRRAHYTDTKLAVYGNRSMMEIFTEFMTTYGSRVVRGIIRPHVMARALVFYCHRERVDEAVHVILADAAHTAERGFPMLIDYADQICSAQFRAGDYADRVAAEFARAGGAGLYQTERATRDYPGARDRS